MFIWIYRLLFLPALLIVAPVLLWKNRRREGHWRGVRQRLAPIAEVPAKTVGRRRIWLQAVSVGEVLAVESVLAGLAERRDVEVVLTTTTSTGYRLAREKYTDQTIAVRYFPVDLWWTVDRAWEVLQPDVFVLMEGERWPEHLRAAGRRGVPVIVINARLSDRSFRRMQSWGGLGASLVRGISRVFAAGQQDAERFAALGMPATAIEVTGNLKLDTEMPELTDREKRAWRRTLGFGTEDRVIVGASTWPGEERALLRAWQSLPRPAAGAPPVRLLIVPRHAERRGEIVNLLKVAKVSFHVRSQGDATGEVDVSLADTTGELSQLVQLGEVVWIGKSLPPHNQGQTPVEAARFGRPVLFGPTLSNFRAIAAELLAGGAARSVPDATGMAEAIREMLADAKLRERMSAAGRAWHEVNRGANQRTLKGLLQVVQETAGHG